MYIPNGVGDLPKGSAQEDAQVLAGYGLRPKEYSLFSAARIDPTKGCHLVIDAFGRLKRDTRLVVVGDLNQVPAYGAALKRQANERVLFIPAIASKGRFMSVVRNCRFFVFPSLTEGMSMMLLEVASMGVPLVCSDIPENTSVLGDRAVYFKSRDVDDLAAKIEWVLGNEEAVLKLADEARRWVGEEFSWDKIIRRYDAAYRRVVSSGPTSAKRVLSPGNSSVSSETPASSDTTVAA